MRISRNVGVVLALVVLTSEASTSAQQPSAPLLEHELPGVVGRLGGNPFSLDSGAQILAFSADGKLLACFDVGPNNTPRVLKIFKTATGKLVQRLPDVQVQPVVEFPADGKSLRTKDHRIDLDAGAGPRDAQGPVLASSAKHLLRYRAKNTEIEVYVRGADVALWARKVDRPRRRPEAACSPRGDVFAVGVYQDRLVDGRSVGDQITVTLYAAETGKSSVSVTAPGAELNTQLAFSPDGTLLVVGGGKLAPRVFETATGKLLQTLPHVGIRAAGEFFAFSPRDGLLARASGDNSSRDGAVHFWDPVEGRQIRELQTSLQSLSSFAISPDGKRIAIGGTAFTRPALQLWSLETGEQIIEQSPPNSTTQDVAFSPDGRTLAAVTSHRSMRVWEVESGEQQLQLQNVRGQLQFSSDGWALSAVEDSSFHTWQTDTGRLLASQAKPNGAGAISRLSADHRLWARGTREGQIELMNAATGDLLRTIDACDRLAMADLAFSPDGSVIACAVGGPGRGRAPQMLRLWNAKTGERLMTHADVTARQGTLCFSPDGALLAALDRGKLNLFDVATGEKRLQLTAARYAFCPLGGCVVCQNGETLQLVNLASGGTCLELPLGTAAGKPARPRDPFVPWDSASGSGAAIALMTISVSPDGRLLAGGLMRDSGVLLWSLAPDNAQACADEAAIHRDLAWLGLDDAPQAYAAAWRLAAAGDRTTRLLRDRLDEILGQKFDRARFERLVRELDSDAFPVRERASAALEGLGPLALPHLKQAREGVNSIEVRLRLDRAIESLAPNAVERVDDSLRRLRIVSVVERVGTSAAAELLAQIARRDVEAPECREASRACVRVKARLEE